MAKGPAGLPSGPTPATNKTNLVLLSQNLSAAGDALAIVERACCYAFEISLNRINRSINARRKRRRRAVISLETTRVNGVLILILLLI